MCRANQDLRLCAFLMYAMWWNKPLTAKQPIILRGPWVDELLAFMYMSSEMSGRIDEKEMRSKTIVKTLFASLHLYSKQPEMESVCYSGRASPGVQTERSFPQLELAFSYSSQSESSFGTIPNNLPSPSDPCFHFAPRRCATLLKASQNEKEAGTAFFERRPRVNAARTTASRPSLAALHRWKLAASALQKYPDALADSVSFTHQSGTGPCTHYKPQQLVTVHSRNWPGDDLLRDVGGLVVGMILWLANFLYGGIHAAAWNEHFPSVTEKWFWRASACYIGFCGGLWVVLNFIVSSTPWLNEFWEKWMDGEKKWWHNVILGTLVFVCGLSLMVARTYIVVEAFLSIRELPVEAYATPSWAQIFPHL